MVVGSAAFVCQRVWPAGIRWLGRIEDEFSEVFHTYATWEGWAFDHSGWNPEPELVAVNADFGGSPVERIQVTSNIADFCTSTTTELTLISTAFARTAGRERLK